MSTVLIIEDEPELSRVLRSYLEQAGYTVLLAGRGDTGLATWEQRRPDLALLDLNLPGMDGLSVARQIRRSSDPALANTPIIMLTARVEETDQLIGLEVGADDYILKPFSPRVVMARVRALLRRAEAAPQANRVLRALDLEIDLDAHTILRAGQPIEADSRPLTPTEFNLLAFMAAHPGRAFARSQLLEAAQGEASTGGHAPVLYDGYERAIDAHIKNLRAKLEPDPKKPRYIETVFGVGYRFAKK